MPTVNVPRIPAGWTSHWYVYWPSGSVTLNVEIPVVSMPVTTGVPTRWKLWKLAPIVDDDLVLLAGYEAGRSGQ